MDGKAKGLSLVEVLVIIAIIIILALILIPVVSGGRNRAARAACLTNMEQIARAIQVYARDNSGKVPPAYCLAGMSDPTIYYTRPPAATPGTAKNKASLYPELWPGRLLKYLKSRDSLICPTVSSAEHRNYFYCPVPLSEESPYTTYGMNWRFSNGGELGGEPLRPKERYIGVVQTLASPPIPKRTVLLIETQNHVELRDKSRTSLLGEGIKAGGNVTPYGDWGSYFWAIRWLKHPFAPAGHGGGCNLILADGHSAYVKAPAGPYPPKVSQIERLGFKWW